MLSLILKLYSEVLFRFKLLPYQSASERCRTPVRVYRKRSSVNKLNVHNEETRFILRVMESYEDFIQRCYNSNNDDEAEDEPHTPLTTSSLIVFHGACILPPVLNEQQRVEMRTLRDTAVSLMTMKRRKRGEEESQSSFADVSISHAEQNTTITDSDIITSAPPALLTCHPLTSTAHDDRSANQLRASPEDQSLDSTQITVLFEGVGHKNDRSHDALDSQTAMMSSGYVTNDNTDLSWMEAAAVRSQLTATGSDIISHAPVDGAILEAEADEVSPLKMADDLTDADEGPYRMSLQNLLKKSQEYRRRQRLLRTQAKALKPSADEHSLSDKENEELPKHIWKTELRKAREKKKEKADLIHTDVFNQTNTHTANHEDISAVFTALPVPAKPLYGSRMKPLSVSRSHLAVDDKYANIPTPQFCSSPVRCKKGGGASARVQKALSRSDLRSVNDGGLMQTQQITQLELNLSSLKTLISDLESTLTLSHADQSDSPAHNCVKRIVTFGGAVQQEVIAGDCGIEKQTSPVGVLTDNSNQRTHADGEGSSLIGSSYDVDAPSSLWSQLTPEVGGHEGVSRVKRRLLMNEETHCSPSTVLQTQEDHVTFLMEEERRQQQELLQSLAVRYQFLRSVSFPCPSAASRLEDTPTSILASSVCTHTELTDAQVLCLAAVVKGFLTRRLLRTERVSHIIRTIKDTQMFLQSFQSSVSCRNDVMLQERVTLQLRSARLELHQLMFISSSCEQMQMIRQDRELRRERRTHTHPKGKLSLSDATRKALERKKLLLMQQRSADRKRLSPSTEEKWKLVPKICRVSKKKTPTHGAPSHLY
nr:uncharacterized protein si:ch73-100l22.3 isoform X2 [Danio rerio]|eukprot:XP_021335607.1 uncharacterized protein si:ch73-100l22.3 isoform X2 [Danio rerio]